VRFAKVIKDSPNSNKPNPGRKAAPILSFVLPEFLAPSIKKFNKDGIVQILKIQLTARNVSNPKGVLNRRIDKIRKPLYKCLLGVPVTRNTSSQNVLICQMLHKIL
jgi:hypothetical protein